MTNNSTLLVTLVSVALLIIIIAVAFLTRGRKRNNGSGLEDYINEQVYIGNLPYCIDENDLKGYFSKYGAVQTVKVVRNFKTGQSKGYAFVTYASARQANSALDAHGDELQGRSLVVRIAKPKQQYSY